MNPHFGIFLSPYILYTYTFCLLFPFAKDLSPIKSYLYLRYYNCHIIILIYFHRLGLEWVLKRYLNYYVCVVFNKANSGHRVQVSQVLFFWRRKKNYKRRHFKKIYIHGILRRYIIFSKEGILRRYIQLDKSHPIRIPTSTRFHI